MPADFPLQPPYLHERYPAEEWPSHLCVELRAALRAMQAVDDIKVVALGLADVKAPGLACILDRIPSEEARSAARRATADYPHVNHIETGIGCREHWAELDWTAPWLAAHSPRPLSFGRRLLSALGWT